MRRVVLSLLLSVFLQNVALADAGVTKSAVAGSIQVPEERKREGFWFEVEDLPQAREVLMESLRVRGKAVAESAESAGAVIRVRLLYLGSASSRPSVGLSEEQGLSFLQLLSRISNPSTVGHRAIMSGSAMILRPSPLAQAVEIVFDIGGRLIGADEWLRDTIEGRRVSKRPREALVLGVEYGEGETKQTAQVLVESYLKDNPPEAVGLMMAEGLRMVVWLVE